MKILDLFAGKGGEQRRSFIEDCGHTLITLDIEPRFKCDITKDILEISAKDLGYFDFIWASPPCEGFSVSSLYHHWRYENNIHIPKSEFAVLSIKLVKHTIQIIKEINPYAWIIENPRDILRKLPFMQDLPRHTVTYCHYGQKNMKPTDLWGIVPNWTPQPACKNGDSCHVRAPRGSQTGTQGMGKAEDKAIVPLALWDEILDALEQNTNNG